MEQKSSIYFEVMFTLYRIGFCSVSKVALIQCGQELTSCCGAETVPKRSQCEHKPYPSYNFQRSLLISKNHLPERGSVAISAPIKVFKLDSDLFRNLSDTERSTLNSGAVLFRSRKCFESSFPSVNRSPIRYTFCDAPFHYRHSVKVCYNFRITLSVFEMWQYKEDRIKRHYKARVGLTEPLKIFMSRIQ